MKLGRKGFAALGGTFILTTCIVQPIGYTAEITAPAKPIYMVNKGTQYFDSTSGSTSLLDMQARWDDATHNFHVYSLSENSSASATSSNTSSTLSSRINQYSPRMPMDQARIGGIGIGDSIDYVKSIYGEPTYVGQRGKNYLYDGLYAYDMTYGDSFKLSVVENSDGTEEVIDIASTANNGLAMPCGIKVGSSIGEVYKNFGMPWRINSAKSIERNYVYCTQYSPKVVFTTNQQHTITRITIIGME